MRAAPRATYSRAEVLDEAITHRASSLLSVSGKTLVFLTNNTGLPALTIGALYKSRWQLELLFKLIRQRR